MKKLLLALAVVTAVAAPLAGAGGWATVGLSSLPAGERWSVDLTVLQHGRTPLEGVAPVVTITNGNGASQQFTGTPTGEPGVYRANVVFPSPGTWSYEIWDGFTRTHTFKPVEIAAPSGGGSFPFLLLGFAVVLALSLAAATVAYRRRDRQPAPVDIAV